jgi:hypothetical protein
MPIEVNLIPHPACREYKAWHEYMLDPKESAVITLPPTYGTFFDQWASKKRNLLRQSTKHGFWSRELSWSERTQYLQDIHAINTSKVMRQGKLMDQSYQDMPKEITGRKTCDHHYGTFIGCFGDDGHLRAYITTNFCGDLTAASQIIGHGNFLRYGIMVNLWYEFVRLAIERNVKVIVYSRWNDGFDGLKFWKKSMGMKPEVLIERL